MADFTPSRIGQANLSGADDALFLKVYGGEVLTAFRERNRFMSRHMIRNITSGKSAQFPATWKASSSYHTPGTELTGQTIAGNERVILIDDLLVSDVFIPSIDEAKSHFEYRQEYAFQQGASLSRTFDQNVAQVITLAARASATVTGGNGGTRLLDADADSDVNSLVASIFDGAQALDEKDVPEEDRYVALTPANYYSVVQHDRVIADEYTMGANGGLDEGRVFRVAGFRIVKSNNVPSTNITDGPSAYQGDFSATEAVMWHRSAAGTVKLLDMATEMEYSARHQGTLLVAKYALGHGILRPEAAVEIHTA